MENYVMLWWAKSVTLMGDGPFWSIGGPNRPQVNTLEEALCL